MVSDITYKTYTIKRRAGWRRRTIVKAGEKKRNFLQLRSAKKWIDKKMGVMADEPETAREEKVEKVRERAKGPFEIVAVKPVKEGLVVVVAPESQLKDGDRIRIEATGYTDINGEYELVMSDDNEFLIEGELDEPIKRRGRVTRIEDDD